MAKNGQKSTPKHNGKVNHALDWLFGEAQSEEGMDADYGQIEPSVLGSIIWSTVFLGGNVQFGTTKNGGKYVLRFFFGEPRKPLYFDGTDEGREEIRALAQKMVEQAAEVA